MSTTRKIIRIDEDLCTGCGECIPNCLEGALQIIDDKARLVSDLFCDGLGACIGHCPEGAMTIEEREAEPYDERAVMAEIVKQGPNVIAAHLTHLREHGADDFVAEAVAYLEENGIPVPEEKKAAPAPSPCGCAGANAPASLGAPVGGPAPAGPSGGPGRLGNWPIQINLVPAWAPYLEGADVLIAADCVPAAMPGFHQELLDGKVLLIGCPKFDDLAAYRQKLANIFRENDIKSVTVAIMVVPCCAGLDQVVKQAIADSGREIPLSERVIDFRDQPV